MTAVEERHPPAKDERWEWWAGPLRRFLQAEPRDWTALEAWCHGVGAMSVDRCRQCLAWLEDQHQAFSVTDKRGTRWSAV